MSNAHKKLITALMVAAFLLSAKGASANSSYDQPDGSSTQTGGTNHGYTIYVPYRNVPTGFTFNKIDTYISWSNCSAGVAHIEFSLWDNYNRTGTPIEDHFVNEICYGGAPLDYTFTFFPQTINTGEMSWQLNFTDANIIGAQTAGTYTQPANYTGGTSITGRDINNDGGTNFYPKTFFNGSGVGAGIFGWQTPPFSDFLVSPDFLNWQVFTDGIVSPPTTGFYFTVSYGTSTPYGVGFDSSLSSVGVFPVPAGTTTVQSFLAPKTASTTPGNYQALLTFYDQSNATITQSSVLHFTITSGAAVMLPSSGAGGGAAIANCGPTAFSLFSVDFGKGMCDLTRFLFVPNQDALNQWTNTKLLMSQKAPFSYLYEVGNDLTSLPTTTTATISPLTLSVASGTAMHISFDAFSSDTIDKYTSSTSRSLVRTLIQWSLYLAFLSMIILEVRKLFAKPKE